MQIRLAAKLKIFQPQQGISAEIPNSCWKYKDRGQAESFTIINIKKVVQK